MLWGNNSARANNAPKNINIIASSNASGSDLYGNTTLTGNKINTIIGTKSSDEDVASTHRGWILLQTGTGPVVSLSITAGGTGYSNSDTIKVTGGTANATANVVTSNTGVIVSTTNLSSPGVFANAALTITTSAGTGASISPVLGGRAGRVSYECLVASGSMV